MAPVDCGIGAAFNGPDASGLAWNAVPSSLLFAITQQVLNDMGTVLRGMNLQNTNWQEIYSDKESVTVARPDKTTFTGPSWGYMATQYVNKADKTTLDAYAKNGANTDITSLSGLTTALSIAQGGTGAEKSSDALLALGGFPATGGTISGDVTLAGSLTSQGFSPNTFQGNTSITGSSQNALSLITSPNSPNLWLNFQRAGGATGWRMGRADGGGFVLVCDQVSNTAMSLGVNDKIYSTANTTKASDGTLKAASPVARIVKSQEETSRSDVDETGFMWCGCGTANEEAEGISISRLEIGVYVLTGSLGLAREGW